MTPCRTVAHKSIRTDGGFWAVVTQREIMSLLSEEREDEEGGEDDSTQDHRPQVSALTELSGRWRRNRRQYERSESACIPMRRHLRFFVLMRFIL